MSRPLVVDCFMYLDEADVLECRLYELYDAVDWFVLCDANVTHQDTPKPSYYAEQRERFAPWADKIVHVFAKGLPPKTFASDPWAREHAQREFFAEGLAQIPGLTSDAVIMQSDVDEIPTALIARNARPDGFVSCTQRGHFWAVDYLYDCPWFGTVIGRAGNISSFGAMRDMRNVVRKLPNGGWHLSWLPVNGMTSAESARRKVGVYCHPEVTGRVVAGVENDAFLRDGVHVDGVKLLPVEVDKTWPRWVHERRCPPSWFRNGA